MFGDLRQWKRLLQSERERHGASLRVSSADTSASSSPAASQGASPQASPLVSTSGAARPPEEGWAGDAGCVDVTQALQFQVHFFFHPLFLSLAAWT